MVSVVRTQQALTYEQVRESIGPQRRREPKLARRVRFHQSWYRVAVLGLPRFGSAVGPNPQPLGSVLTDDDAARGANFTSVHAQVLYEQRRNQGWGVDPVRCTKYLTSSQALTLNVFGPLVAHRDWLASGLRLVLGRPDIVAVDDARVEFAPRRPSLYLNDLTRVDALVTVQTTCGPEALVIETKYADRFNSRRVSLNRPQYWDLAGRSGLWLRPAITFTDPAVNQMVRCHALGAAVADVPSRTTLFVIHHCHDDTARTMTSNYRAHVADPARVRSATLGEFLDALTATATTDAQRCIVDALRLRYVHEAASEPWWREAAMDAAHRHWALSR